MYKGPKRAPNFSVNSRSKIKPLKTKIGNFEWQLISGRLESSGYLPANSDFQYAGTNIYFPKINQLGHTDDWRYLQGYTITYSPKWIPLERMDRHNESIPR